MGRLCSIATAWFLVGVLPCAHAADYYVSTQGNDSHPGTAAQPFRTITRAYSRVAPGVTIIVLPGVYTDFSTNWGLRLSASGTDGNPITLKSQIRGQAVIDGQDATNRNVAVWVNGSYNIIDGFEIRGGPNGGIKVWGSFNRILNNEIHHNGKAANTNTYGQDGIYSGENTRHNVYAGNYIHSNGRTGSNLDHGLYLCGDDELVFNNVLAYNAAYGLQIAGYATVSNLKVYNNVVAGNGAGGIVLWQVLDGVEIKNNILYRNARHGISSWEAHGRGVVIEHNLFYGNEKGNYSFTQAGSDFTYTLGTTFYGDPLFLNITLAGFNARVLEGSPAIGTGQNLSSVFMTDKDGTARPDIGPWDLGAYQHSPVGLRPKPPSGLRVVRGAPEP